MSSDKEKCEPYKINLAQAVSDNHNANQTAQNKLRTVKSAYLSCLNAADRGDIITKDAAPEIERLTKEANTIDTMSSFILKQLRRESGANSSLSVLSDLAKETSDNLEKEIDELKSNIRTERRRFLDADPSASTAVAGLYFTQQPDNRMIIIFLSCFGSFLLIAGLLVMYGYIPLDIVANADFDQRLLVVVIFWVATLFLTYVGFFTFT